MIPILIGIVAIALVGAIVFLILTRSKSGAISKSGKNSRDKDAIIRDANKRLAQNPNNPQALFAMGAVYFEDENWDKAMKTYMNLADIIGAGQIAGIDKFEVYLRYGLSAQKLNMIDHALKAFSMAKTFRQDNFEVNYALGVLEFDRNNYEKAVQMLQHARTQDPDSPAVLRYLGHALFRLKKPKDAMNFIRKAIDIAPEDKESLYTLAECYHEANQSEQALRIYGHLRADPAMGPQACLNAGNIHLGFKRSEAAIQSFEIGLKHQNIKADIYAELRYRLATTHISENQIGKAIPVLKSLKADNPSYKDVNVLLAKYQELNANKNLQIFLLAPSADFIALCRRMVLTYFPKAKVKITNISVNKNEWVDILAEVDTPKWSDLIMFRFIRTQRAIGELIVRDLHSQLKEVKAG